MTAITNDQESESLQETYGAREAGVADLLELYEKVEAIYVQASASISESEVTFTLDSTDVPRGNANLG